MTEFIKKMVEWNKFELTIDWKIFSSESALKAAYNFLDKWYFFFKHNNEWDIILVFTKKNESDCDIETVIWDYYDELINFELRTRLEKDNKQIRESIIKSAIWNSIDENNFVSIDADNIQTWNPIDFDKDIDLILKEIEEDPDLKIDEAEIEKILKEIEEESKIEKKIILNPNKVKDVKKNISDRNWTL